MASSRRDTPALRHELVPLGEEVAPRGRSPQAVVDGRTQVVDLVRPRGLRRALDGLQPDAAHLGLDLAVAVRPDAAARPVPQRLRTVHRARHARGMQHALAAHLAAEDRLLDRGLDDSERAHQAGTAERFFSMTSSRMPAFSSALMFALNIGIVVVRNAEKPTMSGLCSLMASMNTSGATLTPRSCTVKPAPSSMMLTRFLPMSWTSPLTVPMT